MEDGIERDEGIEVGDHGGDGGRRGRGFEFEKDDMFDDLIGGGGSGIGHFDRSEKKDLWLFEIYELLTIP